MTVVLSLCHIGQVVFWWVSWIAVVSMSDMAQLIIAFIYCL